MIPIYRAKKIDSYEWVEGYYIRNCGTHFMVIIDDGDDGCSYPYTVEEIDPKTIAIHFPNMIDKNGKKIFASLSEDGVGGDIIKSVYENKGVPLIFDGDYMFTSFKILTNTVLVPQMANHYEVIGIYKG